MKQHSIRWLTAILTLCFVLALTACHETKPDEPDTAPETVMGTDTFPESETTTAIETQPAEIEGLRLVPSEGVVVYSAYAADWEMAAVDALVTSLSASAKVLDSETVSAGYRVVVGYTAYNEALSADFAAIDADGYIVKLVDDTILIAANSAEGMTNALSAFEGALATDPDGCRVLPKGTNLIVKKEAPADAPAYLGAWGENIDYARDLQNGVQTHYTDANRSKWLLSNQTVKLYTDLGMHNDDCPSEHRHLYEAIANADGIPYTLSNGSPYVLNAAGERFSGRPNLGAATSNMYEMGYYYNNIHIQHIGYGDKDGFNLLTSELNLHMYADKLHVVHHLVCTADAGQTFSGLAGMGQCYELEADRVLQFVAKDAEGLHDRVEDVDWNTAEYVAFDMERAGVFGIILLAHESQGKLTVTLSNGIYTIDHSLAYDPTAKLGSYQEIEYGHRLYTDATHTFDAFLSEAEAERHPLEKGTNLSGAFLQYDALRGAYKGTMPVVGWGTSERPNDYQFSTINMTGDDRDRKFYYYTDCGFGALECAVILDEHKTLLPIALEVSKNFSGENEDPTFDRGDMHYGNTYVPVMLKAGETKTFSLVGLNMNWGQTPLKQLSSIQFFSPYYHLSLGPHESNCISPDGVGGKNYWILPDFRPVGSGLTYDGLQYWANSEIRMLQFTAADSNIACGMENNVDHIDSYGPVYADVTTEYLSDGGHIKLSHRHVELPNEDENRTLYSVRIDVLEDITFKNFSRDFDLFSFNGRNLQYGTLTYLNENNEVIRDTILPGEIKNGVDPITGKRFKHDQYIKLGTEDATYFGYYNAQNFDQYVHPNFALIIKNQDIRIGGEAYTGGFLLHDYFRNNMTCAELSLALDGEVTLKAGDYIYFDIILLPWGRQYDGNDDLAENDDSIQNVRADSVLNPFTIKAEQGNVIEDTFVPKMRVDENGVAKFTITGGASNGVVRVYGLKSYSKPVIKEIVGGSEQVYDNASTHGYDGYMVYADPDGTYSVAFAFDMEACGEAGRTFVVTAGE